MGNIFCVEFQRYPLKWHAKYLTYTLKEVNIYRGSRNGRPTVWNAILALSDKWLSLDIRHMDEQIIIAQMSFMNVGQVHIWFRTSADAMLLVRRTSASQVSR